MWITIEILKNCVDILLTSLIYLYFMGIIVRKISTYIGDNYYGDKPYFTQVTLLFPEESTWLELAKSGDVDVVPVATSALNQTVDGYQFYEVSAGRAQGVSLPYLNDTGKVITAITGKIAETNKEKNDTTHMITEQANANHQYSERRARPLNVT